MGLLYFAWPVFFGEGWHGKVYTGHSHYNVAASRAPFSLKKAQNFGLFACIRVKSACGREIRYGDTWSAVDIAALPQARLPHGKAYPGRQQDHVSQ